MASGRGEGGGSEGRRKSTGRKEKERCLSGKEEGEGSGKILRVGNEKKKGRGSEQVGGTVGAKGGVQ
jgi:hypothetical protein